MLLTANAIKHMRCFSCALLTLLVLNGCTSRDVSSIAGLYSAAHKITVDGSKVLTEDYINIDHDGKMTVYVSRDKHSSFAGEKCYVLASGTDIDAGLQGRTLVPGTSPMGDEDYEVKTSLDTFGILTKPLSNGNVRWFFHFGGNNSTITINGLWNVATSGDQTYSISEAPLASPTLSQLHSMQCGK